MSDTSTATTAVLLSEASAGAGIKLQTTVPSVIRKGSGAADGQSASTSAASTLRGLQNKLYSMSDSVSLPKGWVKVKHPDSGVYYVHQEKGVFTSSDVLDSRIRSTLMKGADALRDSTAWQALLRHQKDSGQDEKEVFDLVLDVEHGSGTTTTSSYYCVSHVERRIFWLEGIGHEEVDIPCTYNKCTQVKNSRAHCIEAQYWKHCELFPTALAPTKELTGNIKDILLQAAADRLLVKFSTSPYNKDDLAYMLNVVKEVESDLRDGSGHAAWILARFMALHNDGVLQSSYGQRDDYFDIDNTRPSVGPYERPLLLAILAPFFFRSPDVYSVELHSINESFSPDRWSNFVHKVDQSIRDSNLLATVLLSTNVGLLAWTDNGKAGGVNAPVPEQIVTYISIICSAGSIIVGLIIFKQYRAKGADTPLRAVIVLERILKERFGLERLAIICSLPYVLLMWGLIAFLGAFGIVFYRETGVQVRIPVTIALAIIVLCLFFCLYTAGPPDKEERERDAKKKRRFLRPLEKKEDDIQETKV